MSLGKRRGQVDESTRKESIIAKWGRKESLLSACGGSRRIKSVMKFPGHESCRSHCRVHLGHLRSDDVDETSSRVGRRQGRQGLSRLVAVKSSPVASVAEL